MHKLQQDQEHDLFIQKMGTKLVTHSEGEQDGVEEHR